MAWRVGVIRRWFSAGDDGYQAAVLGLETELQAVAYLLQFRAFSIFIFLCFGCLSIELLGCELEVLSVNTRLTAAFGIVTARTLRLNSAFSRPDMFTIQVARVD